MGMDGAVFGPLRPAVGAHSGYEVGQVAELLRQGRIGRAGGEVDHIDAGRDVGGVPGGRVGAGENVHRHAAAGQGAGQFPDVDVHSAGLALPRGGQRAGMVGQQGHAGRRVRAVGV